MLSVSSLLPDKNQAEGRICKNFSVMQGSLGFLLLLATGNMLNNSFK